VYWASWSITRLPLYPCHWCLQYSWLCTCLLTIDVCIKELLSSTALFSVLRKEAEASLGTLQNEVFRSAILGHDAAAQQHYPISAQGGHRLGKDTYKNNHLILRKKYNSCGARCEDTYLNISCIRNVKCMFWV
jgi:hypothetical protein